MSWHLMGHLAYGGMFKFPLFSQQVVGTVSLKLSFWEAKESVAGTRLELVSAGWRIRAQRATHYWVIEARYFF
ncbi:MAG: hypothetical protein ABIP52_08145 [Cyclobacteriaceae bacterium]